MSFLFFHFLFLFLHRRAIIVLSLSLFSQTVCNIQMKEEIIMQDCHFSEYYHYYYCVSVFIELFFSDGGWGVNQNFRDARSQEVIAKKVIR